MDNAYMQARAADVKDVSGRVIGILSGAVQGGIDSEVPVILAADDLAPSETVQLDKSKILGFVTAGGSGNSHTAILARTMGIPAIIGVGDQLKPEFAGKEIFVDGQTGEVVVDANDSTRERLTHETVQGTCAQGASRPAQGQAERNRRRQKCHGLLQYRQPGRY